MHRAVLGFSRRCHPPRVLAILLLALTPLTLPAADTAALLIYQRNGKGFVHDNLAASAATLRDLAAQLGLETVSSTNASVFAHPSLSRFRAIIFANSNNEAFETDDQRAAFQRFIRNGGGFVGIHSSTGSERQWDWFQRLQGAKFLRHAPMQSFTARIIDASHPATAHLPPSWTRTDECYFFTNLHPAVHVLLAADISNLRDPDHSRNPGQQAGGVYPLAWYQEFEGARQFYTSLGHKIEHYADPVFRQHLLGGLRWVLDKPR